VTQPELLRIGPVGVDDLELASRARAPDHASATLKAAERAAIQSRRKRYGLPPATDDNLVGLALSGGGIRSATFALGVLQALAGRDLLRYVDYLSTVSGGGYIGTSLLWWLSGRAGRTFGVRPWRQDVPENQRFPYGTDDPSVWRDRAGQDSGPRLLRNLKEKGNYLTPGSGIDAVSMIAVVLRGVILNLLFWIPVTSVVLGCFHIARADDVLLGFALFLTLVFLLGVVGYSVATGHAGMARRLGYQTRRMTERGAGTLIKVVVITGLVASIALVHDWLVNGGGPANQLVTGLVSSLGGLVGGLVTYFRTMHGVAQRVRKVPGVTTDVIAMLAAALIIYGMLIFCHGLAVIVINQHLEAVGLLLAALMLAVSVWVNINHISAHRMYRDRLMEAFMPGFEPAVHGRSTVAPAAADAMRMHEVDEHNSPFPIVNTNLLLVDSKERRRRLRGGDSFILTPRYCGSNATGWVGCRELMDDRMTLPTAMAISGAAANPNTGSGGGGLTRNRLIAMLMSFIGLRLGYWLPNFGRDRPPSWLPNHVWPGLSTALPFGHHEDDWFLELSDGGHFENLGLYELVRRRARLIILCDSGQDPAFAFEDLQCAQRRVAADFGATVELPATLLERLIPCKTDHRFPESDLRLAEQGHIVGRIRYADKSTGTLIYLKTTLIEGLPVELLGYRGANPTFPDQSTGDQFFDEEQFEAYRELGFIIATAMMRDEKAQAAIAATGAEWDAPAVTPVAPAPTQRRPTRAAPAARSRARKSPPDRPDR
jgi:hypothetical protein